MSREEEIAPLFWYNLKQCYHEPVHEVLESLCKEIDIASFIDKKFDVIIKKIIEPNKNKTAERRLKTLGVVIQYCQNPESQIKKFFNEAQKQTDLKFSWNAIYQLFEPLFDKKNIKKSAEKDVKTLKMMEYIFELSIKSDNKEWAEEWIVDQAFINQICNLTPFGNDVQNISENWQNDISGFFDYLINQTSIDLNKNQLGELLELTFGDEKDRQGVKIWQKILDDVHKVSRETTKKCVEIISIGGNTSYGNKNLTEEDEKSITLKHDLDTVLTEGQNKRLPKVIGTIILDTIHEKEHGEKNKKIPSSSLHCPQASSSKKPTNKGLD